MTALREKTVNGVKWSAIDTLSSYCITFVVSLVLARLLTPDEYGQIGIAMIFIAIANCFVDSGLSNAIIRKKDASDIDYSTVFISNLCISGCITLLLYGLAPLIAQYFRDESLTEILRVLSFMVVVNALAIIQRTRLTKALNFKTQTVIGLSSTVTSGVIGIGMAWAGYGTWALVWQQLSRQLIESTMLWTLQRGCPRMRFSKAHFDELFGFGWKIMLSGLIQTVWRQLIPTVLGKHYGKRTLGLYTRAYQFNSLFSENLTSMIQRVSFSSLSTLQDEEERLREAYRKVTRMTMAATTTCLLGLCATAEPMIYTLIGAQWLPCVDYLRILSIALLSYPICSINANMFQVKGRSDLFLRLEIVQKVLALIPLALCILYNIYWLLWGMVGSNVLSYLIVAHFSGRLTGYRLKEQIKDILPSTAIAVGMSIVVWSIGQIAIARPIILVMQIAVGMLVAIGLHAWFKLPEYQEAKTIVTKMVHHKRAKNE